MALNGNEAHTSEEKGSQFDYHCGQDLCTRHVKEKAEDKATSSLSPEDLHVNNLD